MSVNRYTGLRVQNYNKFCIFPNFEQKKSAYPSGMDSVSATKVLVIVHLLCVYCAFIVRE